MDSSKIQKTLLEKIKILLRSTSASALEAMAQKTGVTVQEISDDRKVLGHWMSLISISGDQLHVTFKVQFSIAMARAFAESALQSGSETISSSHSKDFIREYCNLLAGNIKNKLAENKVSVGISLPLLSRGFDDLFFSESNPGGKSVDRWKLSYKSSDLFCISDSEIIREFELNDNFNETSTSGGDVEFF